MFAASASDKEALNTIVRAATSHFKATPRITCEFESERARQMPTIAALESADRERRTREAVQVARQHPRIADAVEILGAKLKDLKIAGQ
jgi:hypothetical protein